MKIKIANPVGFSRIGGRANNEDAIYPLENEATLLTKLFVVCDGMGGHSNGEIASTLTSVGFARYLNEHPEVNTPNNKAEICQSWDAALSEVERSLESHIINNPESRGMGTTLCFLHIHSLGVTIGHIGDSRIYQLRGNKVIFKTEDHSRVNELVKSGQITAEEALSFPGKNIITRAIQGANSPSKIEFDILSDIQSGDYFFICTDGVLEQINDRILEEIFSAYGYTLDERANLIIEKCQNLTKDNYSGYLIEIAEVEGSVPIDDYEEREFIIESSLGMADKDATQALAAPGQLSVPKNQIPASVKVSGGKRLFTKSKDIVLGLVYALGGLVIAFGAYLIYDGLSNKDKVKVTPKQESKPSLTMPPANNVKPEKKPKTEATGKVSRTPKKKKKEEKKEPALNSEKNKDKTKPKEQEPATKAEPEKKEPVRLPIDQ